MIGIAPLVLVLAFFPVVGILANLYLVGLLIVVIPIRVGQGIAWCYRRVWPN